MKKKIFLMLVIFLTLLYSYGYTKNVKFAKQDEKILAKLEKKKGFRPKSLLLMSERENLLPKFMSYSQAIMHQGPLTEKERYLVALAASAVLESPMCIESNAKSAKKVGASRSEIVQTLLIAGITANKAPLHIAYDAVLGVENTETNKAE